MIRQFGVFENPNPAGRDKAPFVVVLQDDLFNDGPMIVVGPLFDTRLMKPIPRLNPVFEIDGRAVVLSTREMASIRRSGLRKHVTSLDSHRDRFIAAIDFLFTGI
ncbi:MAG: CcdB family protein [Bauldia sp.]|nr:CcdB family protein [Bauldia sp.]